MTTGWVKTANWSTGMAVGLCLVAAVLSRTGAEPVIAQGNGATALELRQPSHATRSREVVRPSTTAISNSSEATDARAPTATCRPRRSSSPRRSPGPASRRLLAKLSREQERRRSALPAGGRRRLPCERRTRERLLEPGGQRARSRDDALAGERQARSIRRPVSRRTRPPSISGAPSCPCSTSRSPDLTTSCRSGRRRAPRVPIMGQDPNGPEPARWLSTRCAVRHATGTGPRRALRARAGDGRTAGRACSMTSRPSSRRCSRRTGVERLREAILSGVDIP